MEKINNFEAPSKFISFEQKGESITFTLPDGEELTAKGAFKGPDLTDYEGILNDGESVQVEFVKGDNGTLTVVEITINGEVAYTQEPVEEQFKEAA